MKKLITLLLVMALLVPLCLTANAAAEKKDFYAVTWSKAIDGFDHVKNLYTVNISMLGENVKMGSLVYGSYTDAQVESAAKAMKTEMDKRAEGERYIHFFGPANVLDALMEKEVYFDEAEKQLTELATALFDKYAAIGGKLDGAMMSMLYPEMGSHYVSTGSYHKIVSDSRYKTQIRPLLAERGFVFYDKPSAQTPEIYGISGNAGSKYSNCAAIWNTVMNIRMSTFIKHWAYDPMAKHFPNVHVADYQTTDTDAWMKPLNTNGSVMGGGGNALRAGNTSCEKFYANSPSDSEFYNKIGIAYNNLPAYMGTYYRKTAFNNFRYDTNVAKQCYIADANHDVCFWINKYSTAEDNNTSIANSPYYAEQVFHLCLYDPKPFVLFISTDNVSGDALKQGANNVEELLCELNRIVGYADREPIETPIEWNSEFVISGMKANGKNYWRITPNRDLTTKEKFKVKDSDPTFSVAGQTVTFPGGKIIADSKFSQVSTVGYWVETPANKTPVVTSNADRFEKYPAYIEDYESYSKNHSLKSNNVRDLNAWTVNPKGSDMKIESFAGSKVLAVTGDSILENTKVPANLTLGDAYAKKQSWEVTITIPDGIGSNAKMTLLNYKASGTDFDDGGFKLQGNTLYYATGEADADYEPVYEKLLDVKAGTYTLKRDMNFGKSFFCTYTVTDVGGKVLKQAENIAVPAFSGKVSAIGLTCYDMNKKILLDNYTLRVTGAGADLSVYDTALGTKVTDGAKHNASVTYRLSWANASDKNETVSVKAEIGSSVKTLKTVTIKPGCNGVEYGTVEVKAGQSVRVYLETSIKDEKLEKPAETQPTEEETEATKATKATIPAFTKPTRATKTPTKATKVTKATAATKPTGDAPATDATELTEETQITAATEATEATGFTDATEATGVADAKDKTSPKAIGLIVAISVIVLAAGAGLATWLVLKKKKPAEATETAETTEEPEKTEE